MFLTNHNQDTLNEASIHEPVLNDHHQMLLPLCSLNGTDVLILPPLEESYNLNYLLLAFRFLTLSRRVPLRAVRCGLVREVLPNGSSHSIQCWPLLTLTPSV